MEDQAGRAAGTALDVAERDEIQLSDVPVAATLTYSPGKQLSMTGQSALALELSQVRLSARRALRLSDGAILILDLFIAAARVLIDDSDDRPFSERFAGKPWLPFDVDGDGEVVEKEAFNIAFAELVLSLDELVRGDDAPLKRVQSGNFKGFVRRLVGEGRWNRLTKAAQEDGAIAFVAIRRAVRHLMPLAVALDDCAVLLTPGQLAAVPGLSDMGDSLLQAVVAIDGIMDKALEERLVRLQALPVRPREAEPLAADLGVITEEVRLALEGMTRTAVADLSDRLSRKLKGARDAIEFSHDPVSQSANSQIEFIDRLMRDAFTEDAVVAWVRERFPTRTAELLYKIEGRTRPTKKAQALCFVYAGGPINEQGTFQELAVAGLATARRSLQQLKHADDGTDQELEELRQCMAATEGFFVFAVRVGWAMADDDLVNALRARL